MEKFNITDIYTEYCWRDEWEGMISHILHMNGKCSRYNTAKVVDTKNLYFKQCSGQWLSANDILYRNTYLWYIFLLQREKINARCVTNVCFVHVFFWENKCIASLKLVWEKLCHFYYFKKGRVMFLFSDIISTKKFIGFLNTIFKQKISLYSRLFFNFQN